MRAVLIAAAVATALAGPAMAQGLDVGRLLQEGGILPRQGPDPRQQAERDRGIYEQGRRDEEIRRDQARQGREAERERERRADRRGEGREDRRGEFRGDDRRGEFRGDDRRRVDDERQRIEGERGVRRY